MKKFDGNSFDLAKNRSKNIENLMFISYFDPSVLTHHAASLTQFRSNIKNLKDIAKTAHLNTTTHFTFFYHFWCCLLFFPRLEVHVKTKKLVSAHFVGSDLNCKLKNI